MGFKNDIGQMAAVVGNTSMESFPEVLHDSPCHPRWNCVDFLLCCVSCGPVLLKSHMFCIQVIQVKILEPSLPNETSHASLPPLHSTRCPLPMGDLYALPCSSYPHVFLWQNSLFSIPLLSFKLSFHLQCLIWSVSFPYLHIIAFLSTIS